MQIIQFKENQKEIWNKFIAENSSESFLQAWKWGEFNRTLGRKVWRIGIIESDLLNNKEAGNIKYDLLAAALIIKYDLPFGWSYLYCPRGPVINKLKAQSSKLKVLDFLFNEIKKNVKKEGAMFLRVDPPIKLNQESEIRNQEDYIISPQSSVERLRRGVNFFKLRNTILLSSRMKPQRRERSKNIANAIDFTFRSLSRYRSFGMTKKRSIYSVIQSNFKKSPNEIQPKNTLILDLTKSEEELLKKMKQKTRYNIRLAEKKGVRIRNYELRITNHEYFRKKFEKFWELVKETSRRDKFAPHDKNYYWKMLKNLSGEKDGIRNGIPRHWMSEKASKNFNLQAKLYLAEYKNRIITANIVLSFGDFCVYLHGASSNKYRNVMAPYLLQWRQILDAKKTGCKSYDFWGIDSLKSQIPNPKSQINSKFNDWSGITRFKKGFGGQERNYIGTYDLVFDWKKYYAYKFFRKIKHCDLW